MLLAAAPAAAGDAEDAGALFERGRVLVKDGDHKSACPLFEKSQKLLPALGTELNLALCWTAIGRLNDAAGLFADLASKTEAPDQAKRHDIVLQAQTALQRRIPKLVVTLSAGVSNPRLDDKPIEADNAITVDPGHHVLSGDGAARKDIDIPEAQTTTVALAPGHEEPIGAAKPINRVPWMIGGAGVALVVVGTITGVVVLSKRDSGLDHCQRDIMDELQCDPKGGQLLDSARTLSHVTTGLFIAGGALIGVGLYLKIRDRRRDQPAVTAWTGSSSVGLALEGAW